MTLRAKLPVNEVRRGSPRAELRVQTGLDAGAVLRINFILPFFSSRPIGGFKVAYEYANHLARRGHDVSVIHPRFMRNVRYSQSRLHRIQAAAINVRSSIAPRSGFNWQPFEKNVRILHISEPTADRILDADFVVATAWQAAEYVVEYPERKGKKFYIVQDFDPWIASKDVLETTWTWPLKKITISKWLYQKVLDAGCLPSEVINIPIGVNFEQFPFLNDIQSRPKRIAMLYSKTGNKGSEDGLRALEQCKVKHPDLEVVFFGPAMRSRPSDLPAWITYYGNVPQRQLVKLLNETRIFVCSSLAEGFALPPAEAMACGCAVVSTDCGGNREYVNHGVNALISPAGDSSALATNIIELLENDDLRTKIAEQGRETIVEFSWERSTDRLEEVMARAK